LDLIGFEESPRDFLVLKAVRAGFAGSLTLLSLEDRDLVFQDRNVVAAHGQARGLVLS